MVDLSADEIEIIGEWYTSAAGESATGRDKAMFDLLEKLGIEADDRDLYMGTPEHWIESHRHVVIASNSAIAEYLERHPNLKDEA